MLMLDVKFDLQNHVQYAVSYCFDSTAMKLDSYITVSDMSSLFILPSTVLEVISAY
jgi:hypothetical protein